MMKENKIDRGEVVWRDRSKNVILIITFLLLIPLILISTLIYFEYNRLIGFLIAVVSISYFIYLLLKLKRSKITVYSKGLSMGNVVFVGKGDISPKEVSIFTKWSEISNLKIVGHSVRSTFVSYPLPFLILKKRKEKKLQRLGLRDPRGFIKSLKKLNKIHLLDKKTREKFR